MVTTTDRAPARRRPVAARRVGYSIAAAVDAVLLYAINVRPGWDALAFLTPEAGQVVALVNASLVAGLIFNLVYPLSDPPWLRSLGDLVTTGLGLIVVIRLFQLFPFDVETASLDLAPVIRALLVVAAAGSVIGMIGQVVSLVRGLCGRRS